MLKISKREFLLAAEALLECGETAEESLAFRKVSAFLEREATRIEARQAKRTERINPRRPRKRHERINDPAEIRRLLAYDPNTGILTWNQNGEPAGVIRSQYGYVIIEIGGRNYMAHRLAWVIQTGAWPTQLVDHKNGMPADNRWENLREATHSQNQRNRRKFRTAQPAPKGVSWDRDRLKWRAAIKVGKRNCYLGLFDDPNEAGRAYAKAAQENFGEFARF